MAFAEMKSSLIKEMLIISGLEEILDMHCFANAQIFGAPLENAQNQTFLKFKFRT